MTFTAQAAARLAIACPSRIEHFPVALFSIVMGLAGLALAWLKLHHLGGAPVLIGSALRVLASTLFVFLGGDVRGQARPPSSRCARTGCIRSSSTSFRRSRSG